MKFRDALAYKMLLLLRQTKTLEQIAREFNVTRPAVNQLFKALEASYVKEQLILAEENKIEIAKK